MYIYMYMYKYICKYTCSTDWTKWRVSCSRKWTASWVHKSLEDWTMPSAIGPRTCRNITTVRFKKVQHSPQVSTCMLNTDNPAIYLLSSDHCWWCTRHCHLKYPGFQCRTCRAALGQSSPCYDKCTPSRLGSSSLLCTWSAVGRNPGLYACWPESVNRLSRLQLLRCAGTDSVVPGRNLSWHIEGELVGISPLIWSQKELCIWPCDIVCLNSLNKQPNSGKKKRQRNRALTLCPDDKPCVQIIWFQRASLPIIRLSRRTDFK